jgi:alkanesulfonate monooxygenase SsuD/methylene tetrahydromethanopterin reductase-like flavin-dependent oxidoreductase (luciferase family)
MRYGLTLPNAGEGGDPRTLGELALLAEEAGWDGIFLEDYIVWQGHSEVPTYDPWIALAVMASRTQRIRLGTSVTPLPRRRLSKLARETVTIDHLSQGRLVLGVGLGDINDPGFGAMGEVTDTRQRARMLDEALDVLVGLWSGQPFSYDGTYYHVRDLMLAPTPIQTPRIPIWVGGNWPHPGVMRRAARWDGFMGGKEHNPGEDWHLTPADVANVVADIAQYRMSADPAEIVLGGGHRGPDLERERAMIRSVAEAGATWWIEYVTPDMGGVEGMRRHIEGGPLRIDEP